MLDVPYCKPILHIKAANIIFNKKTKALHVTVRSETMVEFTKQTGHRAQILTAQILTHNENGVIQTFLKQQDLLYRE